MRQIWCLMVLGGLALLLGPGGAPLAQAQGHAEHGQAPAPPAAPTSRRITMEALHAAGGVPPGWRFTVPAGDAAAGRQAFVDLRCHGCHAIKGEEFPLKPGETATAGPELSGMGAIILPSTWPNRSLIQARSSSTGPATSDATVDPSCPRIPT